MKLTRPFTSIGGQAVIEGVMMRSPQFIAVAVRKANQHILIRSSPYTSVAQKYPVLKKPILRGVTLLIESMVQGVDALSYSASVSTQSDQSTTTEPELSNLAIASSLVVALFLGLGLFVALPHFLTAVITSLQAIDLTAQSPFFHLLDGGFKVVILLTYVYLISLMKDIYRVFQYHGAEHKSIYAFEAGDELTVANARNYSTLHPRCGTSFLLFLVLISVAVFSIIFPVFHLTQLSDVPWLNHLIMIFIKMILMLPVAGIAYEFIKACAFRMNNPVFRSLIWPGMVLQKLTTREPTDEQLEVALASLRQVLQLEKVDKPPVKKANQQDEIEISQLSELGIVNAQVSEFPEI